MASTGRVKIAVDIGAGSVKMLAARFDGERILPAGTHEFPNWPLRVNDSLRIDLPGIVKGVGEGIARLSGGNGGCDSIGVDTFGNGYGILDSRGELVETPFHYRDRRTAGVIGKMSERISPETLFTSSGIYPVESRVLMQLFCETLSNSQAIREGETFLPFANLITWMLTGEKSAERTIASVSNLLAAGGGGWNYPLLDCLGIPRRLFPAISDGGRLAGRVVGRCALGEFGESVSVAEVIAHDTESALLASPVPLEGGVFASLGTSIIFGARTESPVLNQAAYRLRFKNVVGAGRANSLCKDVPGFWIVNRCLESWNAAGAGIGSGDMEALARKGRGMASFLDISDPLFRSDETDMTRTIREYCVRTGQPEPESPADTLRCVFESMALQVAWSLEGLRAITGDALQTRLVALNGGTNSAFLLQMIADATGLPVVAGSPIASSLGNVLAQLTAAGELMGPAEVRAVASATAEPRTFLPKADGGWDDALGAMKRRGLLASGLQALDEA